MSRATHSQQGAVVIGDNLTKKTYEECLGEGLNFNGNAPGRVGSLGDRKRRKLRAKEAANRAFSALQKKN